ncbi:MAG: transposase [Candidatus Pacebacteria bacterium]|nr:transposase [Candidatus Paceibacterota bacterium]
MRKDSFIIGQYYHIYNRGTDKRIVFNNKWDLERFLKSIDEFNNEEPIGSIVENEYREFSAPRSKLVDIVCYCLNPNHYHLILTPLVENGIEKFMQKLGAGYTKYFNERYKRSGVLFQGRYKSIHIKSDEYLTYVGAYINLNNRVHQLSAPRSKSEDKNKKLFWKSSWGEFVGENKDNICNKSILLDRHKNINEYKNFAESVVQGVVSKRLNDRLSLDEDLLIEKL